MPTPTLVKKPEVKLIGNHYFCPMSFHDFGSKPATPKKVCVSRMLWDVNKIILTFQNGINHVCQEGKILTLLTS